MTKAHGAADNNYDDQGEYCGPSTASEVFLIFTTHLYLCLSNYNVKCFITLQEGSIATGILPTPNTSLSSLPVDGNIIRNTERDFRGRFYRPRPFVGKISQGTSRRNFFILSTIPDPLRCSNMSKHFKTIGLTSPEMQRV